MLSSHTQGLNSVKILPKDKQIVIGSNVRNIKVSQLKLDLHIFLEKNSIICLISEFKTMVRLRNHFDLKVQMKCCLFIAEFERAAKIRKIAIYRFLISLLVSEL